MKNIYVIPTDKPNFGRYLVFNKENTLCIWDTELIGGQKTLTPHHIYITSPNEETKEGDFCIDVDKFITEPILNIAYRKDICPEHIKQFRIILTTDPDLIAEGVQSIDDEFLEWFVKNPSCESVEIEPLRKSNGWYDRNHIWHWYPLEYKIIIPQEEPNPFELPKALPDDVFYQSLEESKQETLEEAAEQFANDCTLVSEVAAYEAFITGAKYQAEIMYSEEEVEQIARFGFNAGRRVELKAVDLDFTFEKWFEQFKKK